MDISYLKTKLEEEENILKQELGEISVEGKDTSNSRSVFPADRKQEVEYHDEMADRMEDLEERASAKTTLALRLQEVRHALKKIAENKYGLCELSGEPIEEDRLMANPAARTSKKNIEREIDLPPINL